MEDNLTNWEIFVDETYLSKINEKKVSSIATGYYCIPIKRKSDVYKKYKETVYAKRQDIEIKSVFVSDQMNTAALQASRRVGAFYAIQQSTLGYNDDKRLNTDAATKAILLTNYLAPIEILVKKIRSKVTTPQLHINVCLDERQEFQDTAFKEWSNYLMSRLAKKLSTDKLTISITVTIGISADSIGIQIADMLCGGFRREYLYASIEDHASIIPFKYILMNRPQNAFEDSDFLKTYALISLNNGNCPKDGVKIESENQQINKDNLVTQTKNEFKSIKQKQLLLDSQNKCKTFYKNNLDEFVEMQNILGTIKGSKAFQTINGQLGYEAAVNNMFHNFQLYANNLENYSNNKLTQAQKVLEEIK